MQPPDGTIELPAKRPLGRRLALKRLFNQTTDLSDLASGAQEILHLTKSSDKNLEGLQELIQTDPSLVAMILRRVNSSYYRLDAPVRDLPTAAKLVGFSEILRSQRLSNVYSDNCMVLLHSRSTR